MLFGMAGLNILSTGRNVKIDKKKTFYIILKKGKNIFVFLF